MTVTGQFANVGTSEADDDVDAAILMNGVELIRERFTSSPPVAPSGEGGPLTFSADFVAELGVHDFELVLDVNGNITEQQRTTTVQPRSSPSSNPTLRNSLDRSRRQGFPRNIATSPS